MRSRGMDPDVLAIMLTVVGIVALACILLVVITNYRDRAEERRSKERGLANEAAPEEDTPS